MMESLADQHIRRHLAPRLIDALTGFRVVVLHGPCQSGKTTLARRITDEAGDQLDRTAPGLFLGGIVLHMGEQDLKISERIHMRPISSLWS